MTTAPLKKDDPKPDHDASFSDFRNVARIGYGLIFATFGIGGAWAALAHIDSAVIAQGVVSVESRRQVVQHLEGGIVAEIDVRDGQSVRAGDRLFRLDSTTSQSSYAAQRAQLDVLRATEARVEAERTSRKEITFPTTLMARNKEPAIRTMLNDQLSQFNDRRESIEGQVAILNSRITQGEREIEGLSREHEALVNQLLHIDDELSGVSELRDKGLVSKPRLAELQREKARLQGLVGRNMAETAKAENAIAEVKLQIQQTTKRQREELSAQAIDTRRMIADVQEKLAVSENVLKRIDLRAPHDGIVQNINAATLTVGAVVKPGETLLEIVPQDSDLIVDAQISPADVDRLHDGVAGVEIRFPSFHGRTTPIVLGVLQSVSPDRIVNETSREPYFQAVVAIARTDISDEMKSRLRPGMPAEVIFSTGERSVLSFLTRPLTDAFLRAFSDR